MSTLTDSGTVSALLSSAQAAGTISAATSQALTGNLGTVVVAGAAGLAMEDIEATDVTLVTVLIDASSSIHSRGLEDAVREGQNILVDAFDQAKEKDSVLMALWTFNDDVRVHHAYVPIDACTRLDATSYAGLGSTRLYDTWCDALAANVAYAQRLRDGGTPCKSVVVMITDGEDCGSRRKATDCAKLSRELLASEQFTLAFVGVGTDVDFHAVAKRMGVPDASVAVQTNTSPSALRQMFHMVSQSAIRASRANVTPGSGGFFGP
jgi:uncharacterized protein YegL